MLKPYYLRGMVYEQSGDLERARADYERCLQTNEEPMLQMNVQSALRRVSQ